MGGAKMNYIEIISQVFGILGFVFIVLSFQEKTNKGFFVKQALGGILCEVFNITSVIISVIRFGKDGFEKE